MKDYRTTIEKLGVPKGTKVSHDESRDNIGVSGKLLCTVPNGGSLFYDEANELEEVK